jgi:hypothetical protein
MVRSPWIGKKPQRLVCPPQEAPGPGQNDAKVVHLLPVLIELLFSLFLACAVSLLDFANELITLSGNDVQIIVGEFAPFLLNLAFELLPVSCHLIPVHNLTPLPQYLHHNLLQRLLRLHHYGGHHHTLTRHRRWLWLSSYHQHHYQGRGPELVVMLVLLPPMTSIVLILLALVRLLASLMLIIFLILFVRLLFSVILFPLARGHVVPFPARFIPLGPSWGLPEIRGLDLVEPPGDILDPLPRTIDVPAPIPPAFMLIVISVLIAEQVGIGIGGVLHSWRSRDLDPLRVESVEQL